MNYIEFFGNLFLLTFAVFAGLLLAFMLAWPKIESLVFRLKIVQSNKDITQERFKLRMNAYERLTLFCSRIEPKQLMLRNHQSSISIQQFKQILLNDIEVEFQHNLTQQLYVSDQAWLTVQDLKENCRKLIINSAQDMPQEHNVDVYIQKVLNIMQSLESNPFDNSFKILKKEMAYS